MSRSRDAVEVKVAQGLGQVAAAEWDSCANPPRPAAAGGDETFNPFVSHAFLSALEDSGSVGRRTGWSPVHLLVSGPQGGLVAAAPCYLKTHSMGEYVFDGGWADAYERAGGRYYPKLQVSVPFTPVTGPRLLLRADAPATAQDTLVAGLRALREQIGASSTHVTFLTEAAGQDLAARGFLLRTDKQFHWFDDGFGDFEGFLAALAARKRKAIRRERREALASGLTVRRLTGTDLTEAVWDAFFGFYMDTGSRKWGRPYLTRRFFSLIGERMADRILLVVAERGGRPVAGAINFIGDVALYGRNWGCIEDHPFLHFELCYYQAIEYALERGLSRVEAGAQGEHKLARGYRPVTTYSAHDIADPGLRQAVAAYLTRERAYVAAVQGEYEAAMPFRRGEPEGD
ncbi:GNAT family N-acetyltransferase [Enterovirga sp.]|uniref:GNAT family N-acetyltransferase n=1 Tax=Enterovirga sp. TaxID=2026350 RepID=UPI0026247B02|nr:GNAT family N-acetyltransferase [Enterovirga sp.]MDB5591562.1 family N-acetyltransferase [Enterovirga sp.]